MKLKNMWKRFWTLDVHNHAGFTLVELIIVIAILAILSTGAIAGYSVYVERANMTADKALVAEIMNSVVLYSYAKGFANGSYGTVGYVIVHPEGAEAQTLTTDGVNHMSEALDAAYGENWEATLKIKYNGWTDTANMLGMVAGNQYAESVNNSSYINGLGTDELLGDVQSCAGSLAEFLVGIGWSGEESAKALNELLGGAEGELPDILKDYEGEITADVLANAAVFGLASTLSGESTSQEVIANFQNGIYLLQNWSQGETVGVEYNPLNNVTDETKILTDTAHTYAALEAFVGYMAMPSTDAIMDKLDEKIAAASSSGKQMEIMSYVSDACEQILNDAASKNMEKAEAYFGTKSKTDGEAYIGIMQTVNGLDQDYAGSLDSTELFGSTEMADRVNSYVAASSLSALLGDSAVGHDLLKAIANGNYESAIVLVFTTDANGNLGCIPCPGNAKP